MRERTILLVEDNGDDRYMIRRLLRTRAPGYTIVEAATAEAGLERCRTARPDCVLLDYYLPDMDGLEFLDRLRAQGGGTRGLPVPVAMLTGRDDDDTAAEALKRGAEDYLAKDAVNANGLVRAVENAIEKFQIRQELEAQRAAVELRNFKLEALRDELQASVRELADATRAKDRFLAVMSHEMRTPLNAILGYSELLDMELDGELTDGQRRQIERIRVGSRHLLDLVNDVLDLARVDARKLELDLRPVDVGAVIEEVVALLESQAETQRIELVAEPCARAVPHVQADVQRLRQILTNLVGNALKFTEAGSVRVRCSSPGADGMVRVEVVDTGIGIDADVLPLVFTEFYQAEGDLTRRRGGSGLGLAISQRLAQLMGAEIVAESEPGCGSVFTLLLRPAERGSELRAEDVAGHDARMAAHAADIERQGARARVTVVAFGSDANALTQLEQSVHPGVHLVWTTQVDEVATLAARERAALVVLDGGSSDGAAWRAAHAMQETPELAGSAVLLLPSIPAATTDGEPAHGLDLGWVSLVPKPFTAQQLTRAVFAAARGGERTAAGSPRPSAEVLVVDDDPDSRRVASKFLREMKAAVREAPDGETALTEMRMRLPDVVVLDLMMPVLDGFGVLAAMRADPLLDAIPVVVLTAKSLTDGERQFLSRTAVRVLQKGEHRLADVAALVLRAAARTGAYSLSEGAAGAPAAAAPVGSSASSGGGRGGGD